MPTKVMPLHSLMPAQMSRHSLKVLAGTPKRSIPAASSLLHASLKPWKYPWLAALRASHSRAAGDVAVAVGVIVVVNVTVLYAVSKTISTNVDVEVNVGTVVTMDTSVVVL